MPVSTIAAGMVTLTGRCPDCDAAIEQSIQLGWRYAADEKHGGRLIPTLASKPLAHWHGGDPQPGLPFGAGAASLGDDEDLNAGELEVDELDDEWDQDGDFTPPVGGRGVEDVELPDGAPGGAR